VLQEGSEVATKSRKSSSIRRRGRPILSKTTVPVRLPNQIEPTPPGAKFHIPGSSQNGRSRQSKPVHDHPGTIRVLLNGEELSTKHGSRVIDLIGQKPVKSGLPTLGAIVNGRLRPLDHPLVSDCTVRTVEFGTKDGSAIYIRTTVLIL